MNTIFRQRRVGLLAVAGAVFWPPVLGHSQLSGRGGLPTPKLPRQTAPIELTGYWVSVVTEDWRFRMVTPLKGDISGFQPFFGPRVLNAEGQKIVDAWDPEKDSASGNSCKSYGAAALVRVPSRFHITWRDDDTLQIDADAGTQTRLLHFGRSSPPVRSSLQGYSLADWEIMFGGRSGETPAQNGGSLHAVTNHLSEGYLRKNGVPYSDQTTLTEYFDVVSEPNAEQWLIVKSIVEDPKYLTRSFITSTNLKKQSDSSGWNPTPCSAW